MLKGWDILSIVVRFILNILMVILGVVVLSLAGAFCFLINLLKRDYCRKEIL